MRSRLQMILGLIVFAVVAGLAIWAFIEAVQADAAVVGSVGVYDDLLGVIWNKLGGNRVDKDDPEVEALFRDLKARQLMLGASSEMVQAFNNWTDATKAAVEAGDNIAADGDP